MTASSGVILTDLSGGINEGGAPTDLQDNQFQSISNFIGKGKKLYKRPDVGTLHNGLGTNIAHSQNITGLFYGDVIYLLGDTAISYIAVPGVGAVAALTNSDAAAITAGGGLPWSILQYKGVVYAARTTNGGMRRLKGTSFSVAGIPAPLTNAGIGDNGAGAIAAGDAYGYYTFYNTLTGAESNPSPVSPLLTLANNRQIAWTSIDVSTDPQVNARRLYRTTPGAAADSPALFIGQINDNVTTVFADNIPIASMGDEMKTVENGLPIATLQAIETHFERLFATDGDYVYFSEFGLPESFDPTNVLAFASNDRAKIRALKEFNNLLVVGKTNKVYGVSGITPEDFQVGLISEDYGCYSQHSMQVCGGSLIWFTGETFVRYDGGRPVDIASVKLKNTLAGMSRYYKQYIVATVDPSRDLYIVSYPNSGSGAGENTNVIAYNYKNDAWFPLSYTGGGYSCFSQTYSDDAVPTDTYMREIYTARYDTILYNLFPVSVLTTQAGEAITCTLKTKDFTPVGPGRRQGIRRVLLQGTGQTIAAADPSVTLTAYRDKDPAALKTRTVTLSGFATLARNMVGVNLSTVGKMGASVAMGLSSTDINELEVIAIEIITKDKRVKVV